MGICEDEIEKDAYEAKILRIIPGMIFPDGDIENALNFYHESFITFCLGQRLKKNKGLII